MSKQVGSPPLQPKGFSWLVAAVFIIGETAGSGLVAMPNAIKNTGLIGGPILLCLLAVVTSRTAMQLGDNWLIMQKRWPQYLEPCRSPYAEMAYRSIGGRASRIAHVLIQITLFGGASVFSLLAARNIADLLHLFGYPIHFCISLFAVAIFLWPFMMLRSPMHFWQVSIGAALSTTIAVILILIGTSIDIPTCFQAASYTTVTARQFSLGFGTIVFAYGGHPVFPTIQHDMAKPRHFGKAVILSYIVLFLLYSPVALSGYAVYGTSISDSVISSIQTPILRLLISVLITLHVLFSILIIINPLHQGVEEHVGVKHEFGIGRVIVRTIVLFLTTFVASLLPNFGVFLDLVGSTSMTALTLVFPGLFSLYLEAAEKLREEAPRISNSLEMDNNPIPTIRQVFARTSNIRLLVEAFVICGGVIFGVISTVNALLQASQSPLASPCFVQLFSNRTSSSSSISKFYCCGKYRNISSNSWILCDA
uniref:Aa_trans domain-containing protein n=1 Tax=Haemonchus contortus TaxID=6289 RepID=A0A7I4YK94_HAECO|nr:Amino acid transporter domain containing protein [Haemonchus contortus]